jgi:RNA polymerase sigma-70 factor (ECF subfamily)
MSDGARFRQLVLPHLDAGYNLARWLARDAQDAEDVVQEACLRALKYLHGLRADEARAWFLTIVRHAYYDWCQRNRPQELMGDARELLESTADPGAIDPEQAALRSADARLLAAAIEALPLAFREVLILREIEEFPYRQIAQITGTPIGTVMSRLARARALLQQAPQLREMRVEPHRGAT